MVKAGPQINFDGVVLERFKKRPLASVTVKLMDLDGVTGDTDDDGHFAFVDVPPGTHKVELSHPKLITVDDRGDDRQGQAAHGEVPRRGASDEDVDDADRRARAAHQEGGGRDAHPHRGGAARPRHAGRHAQGGAEPARRRRARRSARAQLIVWGSAPNETRVNVDGVEIPALYHVGGLRSTMNSDLVRSIDLSPGSLRRRVRPRAGRPGARRAARRSPSEGVHGYVAADVIDASAMVSAALDAAAARWRSPGATATSTSVLPRVTLARTSATSSPSRATTTTRRARTLALRQDEELALTFLASDDHLRRTIPVERSGRGAAPRTPTPRYKRLILRYTRLLPDGASFVVTPSIGYDTQPTQLAVRQRCRSTLRLDTWQYAPARRATAARLGAARRRCRSGIDCRHARSRARAQRLGQPAAARGRHRGVRPAARRRRRRRSTGTSTSSTRRPSSLAEIVVGKPDARRPGCASSRRSSTAARCCPPASIGRRSATRASTCPTTRRLAAAAAGAPNPRLVAALSRHQAPGAHGGRRHLRQPPDAEDLSAGVRQPDARLSRALHVSRRRLASS